MTLTINHKPSPHGTILIVTDTDLLNKQFEDTADNGTPIFLDLTSQFYQGKESKEIEVNEATVQELKDKARGSYILHITGHKALAALEDMVDKQHIIIIQEIPHAQVYLGA